MAGKDVNFEVNVDASDGIRGLKDFSRAAQKAGKDAAKGLEDTASAGDKARAAIITMAQAVDTELRDAAEAANKLGQALGPELTAKMDLDEVVLDLNKLGVEFTDITADADKFALTLKEVDDIRLKQVGDGLGGMTGKIQTARGQMDGLKGSAGGAKSALANVVGNAGQDIFQLGGIAGSAGVAVGQLSEYFADARLDAANAGKSIGQLAGEFAPAAAATAGLGVALVAGTKLWEGYKKAQAEVQRQTDAVAKSLIEVDGTVEQVNESLAAQAEVGDFGDKLINALSLTDEKINDVLSAANQLGIEFTDVGDIIAGFGEKGDLAGFNLLVESIRTNLHLSQADAVGVAEAVGQAGTNWNLIRQILVDNTSLSGDQIDALEEQIVLYGQIGQAAKDTDINEAAKRYLETLKLTDQGLAQIAAARQRLADQGIVEPSEIEVAVELNRTLDDTADSYDAAARAADRYNRQHDQFVNNVNAQVEATKELVAEHDRMTLTTQELTEALHGMQDPLTVLPGQWDALITDFRDGVGDVDAFTEGINVLAEMTGKEPGEILQIITDQAAGLDAAAESVREFNAELATSASRAEGITDAFARINQASQLQATSEVIDFADAMHGLAGAVDELADSDLEAINLGDIDIVPDTWDEVLNMPEELAGVVDAIGGMRDQVQSEMAQAFERGGSPEALQWADNTRQAITDSLTEAGITSSDVINQILTELGILDDTQVEATIAIAHEEQVLNALATITSGIQGIPASTAFDIQMAINDGDPATALGLINDFLISVGQEPIAVDIAVSDNGTAAETGEAVDTVAEPRTATVTADPDTAAAADDLLDFISQPRFATIKAIAQVAEAAFLLGTGAQGVSRDRTADIIAIAHVIDARNILDEAANPGGVGRTAHIYTQVHGATTSGASAGPGPAGLAVTPMTTAEVTPLTGPSSTSISNVTQTPFVAPSASGAINVTINAGVLGNQFDVERTVARALRRHQRVNGRR